MLHVEWPMMCEFAESAFLWSIVHGLAFLRSVVDGLSPPKYKPAAMKPLVVLFLALTACNTTMPDKSTIKFDKQGHRGCRALMPENTIPAMIKAIDLGVNTLELDVVITQDNLVLVSHEPFFNHEISTKPDGKYVTAREEKSLNIYRMTYAETTKFDVGLKPHPRFPKQEKIRVSKPLLAHLIDTIETYCKKKGLTLPMYNIETKLRPETDNVYHPAPREFVKHLMQLIADKGISERAIIQSFDIRTLQDLHTNHPRIKTALLIDEGNEQTLEQHIKLLGFKPTIYSPHYSFISKDLVGQCKQMQMRLIPWTVNSREEIIELKKAGVDGIITDDPTLFN